MTEKDVYNIEDNESKEEVEDKGLIQVNPIKGKDKSTNSEKSYYSLLSKTSSFFSRRFKIKTIRRIAIFIISAGTFYYTQHMSETQLKEVFNIMVKIKEVGLFEELSQIFTTI